jgi:hypothetical protein
MKKRKMEVQIMTPAKHLISKIQMKERQVHPMYARPIIHLLNVKL